MTRAFVLGAGMGTRLRPLTGDRAKPLVPIFGKPLITFAFDHLMAAGVKGFVVNTHHCPCAYDDILGTRDGRGEYCGARITLRHEPVLLDTGGGIKNVEDLLCGQPFLVHNGDVLADLDLPSLIRQHTDTGADVTLGLRSSGGPLQVGFDPGSGRVIDIRGSLLREAPQKCLFTGIYAVSAALFSYLRKDEPNSLIPALLKMIEDGRAIHGRLLDEGVWWDLGTVQAYRKVHMALPTLSYWERPMTQGNVIGQGAHIGEGTTLEDCILWPGAKTASRIRLKRCIVRHQADRSAEDHIF